MINEDDIPAHAHRSIQLYKQRRHYELRIKANDTRAFHKLKIQLTNMKITKATTIAPVDHPPRITEYCISCNALHQRTQSAAEANETYK